GGNIYHTPERYCRHGYATSTRKGRHTGTDPPPGRAGPQRPPRRTLARLAARRPRPPRRTGGCRPGPRRPGPSPGPRPRDPAPEGELTGGSEPEPSTSAQVAWPGGRRRGSEEIARRLARSRR